MKDIYCICLGDIKNRNFIQVLYDVKSLYDSNISIVQYGDIDTMSIYPSREIAMYNLNKIKQNKYNIKFYIYYNKSFHKITNIDVNDLQVYKLCFDPILSNNNHLQRVVLDVVAGKYGNGIERKKRLEAVGYDYRQIQNLVNEYIKERSK